MDVINDSSFDLNLVRIMVHPENPISDLSNMTSNRTQRSIYSLTSFDEARVNALLPPQLQQPSSPSKFRITNLKDVMYDYV
jgi:hypothetical protein